MGDTSMLRRLSMTSALRASWRAVISILEQCGIMCIHIILFYTGYILFMEFFSYSYHQGLIEPLLR